jgi:hypothetical protein
MTNGKSFHLKNAMTSVSSWNAAEGCEWKREDIYSNIWNLEIL